MLKLIRRTSFAISAMVAVAGVWTPAVAQTCLQAPVMSESGEQVMSPFGVDRSSSPGASAGYHQGLDITNSAGRGDPILAGVYGTVFVAKDGSGGLKVGVTTDDGKQRFIFFHLDAIKVRVGQHVTPTTVVGVEGSSGVQHTAVHLHLSTLLRGSELRNLGNSGGRVWRSQYGWVGTKSSAPLTASQISSSLPNDYYFVNPETYLHHRIKFVVPERYKKQGIIRPDNLTLPTTCKPSDEFFDRSSIRSSNGGASESDGLQADAGYRSIGEEVGSATQEFKEAAISLGQVAMGAMSGHNTGTTGASYRALGWAALAAQGGL